MTPSGCPSALGHFPPSFLSFTFWKRLRSTEPVSCPRAGRSGLSTASFRTSCRSERKNRSAGGTRPSVTSLLHPTAFPRAVLVLLSRWNTGTRAPRAATKGHCPGHACAQGRHSVHYVAFVLVAATSTNLLSSSVFVPRFFVVFVS